MLHAFYTSHTARLPDLQLPITSLHFDHGRASGAGPLCFDHGRKGSGGPLRFDHSHDGGRVMPLIVGGSPDGGGRGYSSAGRAGLPVLFHDGVANIIQRANVHAYDAIEHDSGRDECLPATRLAHQGLWVRAFVLSRPLPRFTTIVL